MIAIVLSPLIFYSYKVFPDVKIWETPFFTFDSIYFNSVHIYVWTLAGKLIVIFLLAIWFATCKHWWYHAIMVPLGMFIFQFINLFLLDFKEQDEMDIYFTVPLVAFSLFVLYYVRRRIKENVEIINLQDDVNEDLKKFERLDELKKQEKEKRARMGSRYINELL